MEDGPDYYDVGWFRDNLNEPQPDVDGKAFLVGCVLYIALICLCAGALGWAALLVGLLIGGAVICVKWAERKKRIEKKENLERIKRQNSELTKPLREKFQSDLEAFLEKNRSEMSESAHAEFKQFILTANKISDFKEFIERSIMNILLAYDKKAIVSTKEYDYDKERYFMGTYGDRLLKELEIEKYLFSLLKKWRSEYESDPLRHSPPESFGNMQFQARSYISAHGLNKSKADKMWLNFSAKKHQKEQYDKWSETVISNIKKAVAPIREQEAQAFMNSVSNGNNNSARKDNYPLVDEAYIRSELKKTLKKEEFFLNIEQDRNRLADCYAWLVKLEANWHRLKYKKYSLETLEKAKQDYLTLGREKATEIWFDYPAKLQSTGKDILKRLEENIRKDMADSPYWKTFSEEKRERAVSRFLKEIQMDLEKLGAEKTLELWLDFIKKEDEKRNAKA